VSRTGAEAVPSPRRPDDEEIVRLTGRLLQKIVSISTDGLRAKAAGDALQEFAPSQAALVLGRLVRLRRDHPNAELVVAALARALARGDVDLEFAEATRACARSRADRFTEALLATGPAAREYDQNQEQFVDRRMRSLTLGERRAMSRSRDIDLLVRLAHDQDRRVIQGLLQNPRLTEREAVIIASRRPTHTSVLEAVLASRFGLSPRVRRAVGHNPYAPVALAARAIATLSVPELLQIQRDERLPVATRDQARTLIVGRRTTPAERARAATPPASEKEVDEAIEALLGGQPLEPEREPTDP
jgi:hypothetical protein